MMSKNTLRLALCASALLLLALAPAVVAADDESSSASASSKSAPPPFFLQDLNDSLCLAGEEFKRCSIDTLWYIAGTAGSYQVHKRPIDGVIDEEEDGLCLAKKSCKDSDSEKIADAKVSKCSHCGAKSWNILGDEDTGYILAQGTTDADGKAKQSCLFREPSGTKVMTGPCDGKDTPFSPLHLQFASASDVKTMSSIGARLVGAASDGDKKAVQALLKETQADGSKVDINTRDWDGLTALIPAASGGHLDLCKFLVKEGIDVDASDKDGITALMEASIMGHVKVAEFLLNNGATVDQKTESGITALWLASSEGKADVAKLLLEKGADPSNTRSDEITALMTASVGGHIEVVKMLLEMGADEKASDKDGMTALMNAAEKGSVETLRALVENANKDASYLDALSNTGLTAMMVACAQGQLEAVEYLIEAGASVSTPHDSGITPLMYAAANDYTAVMEALLEKGGADIEEQHNNGGTALLEAATGGAFKALKWLMDRGANVEVIDNDGVSVLMAISSTGNDEGQALVIDALQKKGTFGEHLHKFSFSGGSPIMFSSAGGHTNCTKKLIELGANVNDAAKATPEYKARLLKMMEEGTASDDPEPSIDGVTSLHVAALGGHLETINLLLESGADPTIKDEEDRTALTVAIKGNFGEAAAALVKHGADPNTQYVDEEGVSHNLLFDSIMVENEAFAKLLVEKGADLYFKDDKQVSTLLQACHRGFEEVAEVLIAAHKKSGSDVDFLNDPSDEGVSPLIAAASEGHTGIVKMLAEAGAFVNAKDTDETTALMAASARGHVEVVKELLAAGANVNEQNADGHSALMFAYNGKNQVETLFERYSQYIKEAKDDGEKDAAADGGTGPIIRESLDNHTALVDMLLKNGADETLKDKEGHTAKDFDYHPDADSEVLDRQAKAEKIRDESKNEL